MECQWAVVSNLKCRSVRAAACNCCFSVIAAVGLLFALWGVFEEKITNSGLMRSEIAGNNAPPSNRELFSSLKQKFIRKKALPELYFDVSPP